MAEKQKWNLVRLSRPGRGHALFGSGLLTGVLLCLVWLTSSSGDLPFDARYDPLPQTIYAVKLADRYDLAGEELPLEYFDVTERLERELLINTYFHSSTLLHLKLAVRFFPLFDRIFAEEGIPSDLKYLAVAESSLRNAVSSAGARGIWQFRDEAARELDLEVSPYVDERYDPERSTRAACSYLKKLRERFGSWTLATAAYNMGPTALQRAMEEQKETSYYDLNLSDETNRYIFRIVAIKEIMKHPDKFGFFLQKKEQYPPLEGYTVATVQEGIPSLADFAHQHQITYRQLKLYNPWLLKSSLPNPTKKTYRIRIPK